MIDGFNNNYWCEYITLLIYAGRIEYNTAYFYIFEKNHSGLTMYKASAPDDMQ